MFDDWFNWLRLLILIPGVIWGMYSMYKDTVRFPSPLWRGWMTFAGLYYIGSAVRDLWEDFSDRNA